MRVTRALLTFIAGILWVCGWIGGKTALLILWIGAALQLGWADARGARSDKK